MTSNGTGPTEVPDDATLLAAVARLWAQVDPPPADLVDGVLARLAAEDLELELLTLVTSARDDEALAGVRHLSDGPDSRDEPGAWSLEYDGPDFHVYVRLTRIEERHRLDGWVVPARPVTVELRTDGRDAAVSALVASTRADEHGRFELPDAPAGLSRLVFPAATTDGRPRVTPPFWI